MYLIYMCVQSVRNQHRARTIEEGEYIRRRGCEEAGYDGCKSVLSIIMNIQARHGEM